MNIVVDNQLVRYEMSGTGKVLVLLHGWGADADTFQSLATELSKQYKIIRLDFPGFGQSPVPTETWEVGNYATFVAKFLKKLGVDDVYAFIGHSFGGRVIIKGVGTQQLSSKRLVLIDAAGVRPRTTAKDIILGTVAKTGKATLSLPGLNKLKKRATRSFRSRFGSDDYKSAGELTEIFKKTISEDLTTYLPLISQSTLLIWGKQDEETPVSDAEQMYEAIPSAQLEIYENAGHFAYVDEPQQTVDDIRKFLA